MKPKIQPTVLIDTREQEPWGFGPLPVERETLPTGDYSVKGLEHLIAIERKSLDDLLGCIGYGRDRFKRELQRLQAYRFPLLVIEADAETLRKGAWRSKLKPTHVIGSLAAWTARNRIPTWLGGDHETASIFARTFLVQCTRILVEEQAAAAAFYELSPQKTANGENHDPGNV